jgi:hypothetical protein
LQAQTDGINKLCPLQYEITVPNHRPEIVLDDLGKNVVRGRQGTNPDGSGTLLTMRDSMEKFSKLIQRRRQDNLIKWAGRNLEHRHPNELADDLRINNDNVPCKGGLKNHPSVITLNYLEMSTKLSNQPGKNNAGVVVEIATSICLNNLTNIIQWSHHNAHSTTFRFAMTGLFIIFGSKDCHIFFRPLSDSALRTAIGHDSATITNKICKKYCPKY